MLIAAFVFVFAEFILATLGAYFAFRKKHFTLAAYLAFRALADLGMVAVHHYAGGLATSWLNWIQKAIQYLFLCVLSSQIIAQYVNEKTRKAAASICCIVGIAAGFIAVAILSTETDMGKRLAGSLGAAALLLAILLLICRYERKAELCDGWKAVSDGVLIAALSNAFCFAFGLLGLVPLGEVAALGTLAYGMMPATKSKALVEAKEIERLNARIEELTATLKAQPYLKRKKVKARA